LSEFRKIIRENQKKIKINEKINQKNTGRKRVASKPHNVPGRVGLQHPAVR
jgi:hypothetical protein